MKKLIAIFKFISIFGLSFGGIIFLYYFFYYNQMYHPLSIDVEVNWMITILYFLFFFYILFFLIKYEYFSRIFIILIITGTLLWILIYFLELFKIVPDLLNWAAIRNSSAIICITLLSPGLTINIFKYVRNNSNHNKKGRIFKNFHIHEGIVGVVFVIIAFLFLMIRYSLIQFEIFRTDLRIILAVIMILLYLFLFSGSFLLFRDRRDLIRLKFIERREILENVNDASSIFSPTTPDSRNFLKSPRILMYPFALLLNSLAVNLMIHGLDLLPERIFHLSLESIVLTGIIFCLISGGLIGIDWYRFFKRMYPIEVNEIENELKKL